MRVIATSPSARGSVKIRHSQQMEIIQNKNKNNSTTKYPKSRLRYCDAAKKGAFSDAAETGNYRAKTGHQYSGV